MTETKRANIMSTELKITSSVLKMIRKISEASVSEELGDYHIGFSLVQPMLSMNLWLGEEIKECFNEEWGVMGSWLREIPKNEYEIKDFESHVELALEQILNYIKERANVTA